MRPRRAERKAFGPPRRKWGPGGGPRSGTKPAYAECTRKPDATSGFPQVTAFRSPLCKTATRTLPATPRACFKS